ncbi:MAG TPA: GspH/FimT family pseudopilin [Vicinamibacterales bacterium]|jgi:prepilin-type N-terminal cleavage/methylation domain-containing protein
MSRRGYSLIELVVCVALMLVLVGVATPAWLIARAGVRAVGAADYVASRLHVARLEALKRRANVAVRFEAEAGDFRWAMYADGNGNGVRTAEIAAGIDPLIRAHERLSDHFPGVGFRILDLAEPIDGADGADQADPIRVGRSRMISFSPTGTSSSGTVYIGGQGPHQLAVRVLGATGRIRALTFNFSSGSWEPR